MRKMLIIIYIGIILISPANGRKGVGLSGPDQTLTIPRGSNLSSYVRIYNTGNEISTYIISIKGNASILARPERFQVAIPPDENVRLSIRYSVPSNQSPGLYTGSISISIQDEQIAPGINRNIELRVTEALANRAPSIKFIQPDKNILSGIVEILVESLDPDGDEMTTTILADETLLSTEKTYLWDTSGMENGEHLLIAVVSDGRLVNRTEMEIVIQNEEQFPPWMWIVGSLGLFTLWLILAALYARARIRKDVKEAEDRG